MHLLLNLSLRSSVVRAMQGLNVNPGSIALDKDLNKQSRENKNVFLNKVELGIKCYKASILRTLFITQVQIKTFFLK